MKILFITHYSSLYGANKSLMDLISGLMQFEKYEVDILTPFHGELVEVCKEKGINIHIRRFEPGFAPVKRAGIKRFFGRLKHFLRVFNLLRKLNPDIIYSNTSVVDIGIFSALIFRKKHIWHIREFGDLDYDVYYDLGRKTSRKLLEQSDRIIYISHALKSHISPDFNKGEIIYNGVVEKSAIGNSKCLDKRKIKIGIVGYIIPSKGQLESIKAIHTIREKYDNIYLELYGDGDDTYKNELESFVEKNQLSDVVSFKGYLPSNLIYSAVDILLMCSKNEAMGRVTVEAMANGIPVIAKYTGANPELIEDGYNGLLYSDDHRDLAKKIEKITTNSMLYHTISKNGVSVVREKFTIEKYVDSIHKLICDLNSK